MGQMNKSKIFSDKRRKRSSDSFRLPRWLRTAPIGLLVIVMALLLVLATFYGASRSGDQPDPRPTETPSQIYETEPTANPNMVPAPDQPEIQKVVDQLEAEGLEVGVAVTSIATTENRLQGTWTAGSLRSGAALATADIPVALAVLVDPKQPEDRAYLFDKSLTQGSPAGDDALWAFLGTHDQAVSKTLRVLHSYGDWGTSIPSEEDAVSQPYKQILWPLENQAEFMAHVQCDWVHTVPVMARLDEPTTKPIGLQIAPRSFAKSGDETTAESFKLRQTGLIDLPDGTPVAVSIMIDNPTGDKEATKISLTQLARAVYEHASGFARPSC